MKKTMALAALWLAAAAASAQTEWLRMQEHEKGWFVGGQLSANVAIADNITDHSTAKYLGDALGAGFDVYVGKYLSKSIAIRAGLGYQNVKNRGDNEWIEHSNGADNGLAFRQDIKGEGYYHWGVLNVNADALFDFSAMGSRGDYRKLHLIGYAGLGLLCGGEKKYDERTPGTGIQHLHQMHIDEKAATTLALRLGVMLDLKLSDHVSLNLDCGMSMTGDKFDGIDYSEPVDFLLKPALGITYCF